MPTFSCKALLFDLDGVLVDSMTSILRHWERWGAKHGISPEAILEVAHGRPSIDTIRLVAPHLDAASEAAALNAVEAVDLDGVEVIPGAAALLSALPPEAWAVATSGTKPTASARLRHAGLPLPGVLVTAEDVLHGKPDPQVFQIAASRLGAGPQDCIVIEDSPAGVQAACSAGMRVIAVASTHPPQELAQAQAIAGRLEDIRVQALDGMLRVQVD